MIVSSAYTNPGPGILKVADPAADSILRAIAYFDIFQYPLNKQEIRQYLDLPVDESLFEKKLQSIVKEGRLFTYHGYFMLQDDPQLVARRKLGNDRAEKLLSRAMRIGRFLFRFPFVRGIGISGSLSKNYADKHADIDFFVITTANRLWLARSFMHLYKKLTFLTGRQHYYCMNYYVDEESMILENQNIFTAVELKTLIPVSGNGTMQKFSCLNQWADEWLPFCPFRKPSQTEQGSFWIKKMIESFFNNRLGSWLDDLLWKFTSHRWQKKEAKGLKNGKGQMMGLITGKHYARSNPGAFQESVLDLFEKKLMNL